jgi:Fungal protein kinase
LISDRKDATDTLIREGLDDSTGLGKRSRDEMPKGEDPSIHVTYTDMGDIEEVIARETGPPVSRVRTRVLLSTYGWLIKYFSTRRELLVVLRDAIKGRYE